MGIRCRFCGEYFCPCAETMDLIAEGFILASSVNVCDECFEMIEHPVFDMSDMFSDADPGL